MPPAASVSLQRATAADAVLLSNLLELYVHDLSVFFPHVTLGEDGRFGYAKLPLYLDASEPRHAFLIRAGEQLAGFALVTRGSPVSEDPEVHDVAEFFVLRQHRRSGIGARAAQLLFRTLPGRWTVRVLETNAGALSFWRGTVRDFTHGAATEAERPDATGTWRVFAFGAP